MNEERSTEFCSRWKQLNTGDSGEIRLLIANEPPRLSAIKKIVRGGIAKKAKPAVSVLYKVNMTLTLAFDPKLNAGYLRSKQMLLYEVKRSTVHGLSRY
jgi:hypothetical protein